VALFVGSVSARDAHRNGRRIMRAWTEGELPELVDPGLRSLYTSAQVDTKCIVWYDFEPNNVQGWQNIDKTEQLAVWTHIDDFAGLTGGDFGNLVALENDQSWWCGAREDLNDPYLCGWDTPPGYGASWAQTLQLDVFPFLGFVHFEFLGAFDSEKDWDQTFLEYDAGDGNWVEIDMYDGRLTKAHYSYDLYIGQVATKLRFHFLSDDNTNDEDGRWNSDGAFIVDSLLVVDQSGTIDFEDCELANVNDTESNGDANLLWWRATADAGYGVHSGLATNLDDYDPCGDNFGAQWVFFLGPKAQPSATYPGLFDTPPCDPPGGLNSVCQDEVLISPIIDLSYYSSNCDENQDTWYDNSGYGGVVYRLTVYRDLPVANLVFYTWSVRDIDAQNCPQAWKDRNYVYYGPDRDYIFTGEDVSDLVGENRIQLNIGCTDMCKYWYLKYGNCGAHTPSPYIDNTRLYTYETVGPQWSSRDLDLFQDQFPEDGPMGVEEYVRADMASDLNDNEEPVLRPGDSIVVTCTSPKGGGIKLDGNSDPMVYLHVRATYIGPAGPPWGPKPAQLYGPSLEGTWGHYDSDDGSTWTIIQCDSARASSGAYVGDVFMVDLNDSLFTRGYMIEYYFSAEDNASDVSYYPQNAQARAGRTLSSGGVVYQGVSYIFEMTCLPIGMSDYLYVDDFHGRGTFWGTVEQYFNPTFMAVLPSTDWPERYDVNNPSSLVGNGMARSAQVSHLTLAYEKIVWDCGNLSDGTIGDGSTDSEKIDDCTLILNWMKLSERDVAFMVWGDDVAQDFQNNLTSTQSAELMNTWCGTVLHSDPNAWSYYDLTGGRVAGGTVTPVITGTSAGPFYHLGIADQWYAFGGCPIINQFDVLDVTENGVVFAEYPPYGVYTSLPACIGSVKQNAGGYNVSTLWFGHSFMYIRPVAPTSPPIRNHIFQDAWEWFLNPTEGDITGDDVPRANKLSQNFPNPFNPATMIKFDVKEKGVVSLKIYNVAGQLVKTLVNGTKDAGSYSVTWDGTNNRGAKVASGVYFYKFNATGFEQTKKMVMLR
jgi:hypothetical protein